MASGEISVDSTPPKAHKAAPEPMPPTPEAIERPVVDRSPVSTSNSSSSVVEQQSILLEEIARLSDENAMLYERLETQSHPGTSSVGGGGSDSESAATSRQGSFRGVNKVLSDAHSMLTDQVASLERRILTGKAPMPPSGPRSAEASAQMRKVKQENDRLVRENGRLQHEIEQFNKVATFVTTRVAKVLVGAKRSSSFNTQLTQELKHWNRRLEQENNRLYAIIEKLQAGGNVSIANEVRQSKLSRSEDGAAIVSQLEDQNARLQEEINRLSADAAIMQSMAVRSDSTPAMRGNGQRPESRSAGKPPVQREANGHSARSLPPRPASPSQQQASAAQAKAAADAAPAEDAEPAAAVAEREAELAEAQQSAQEELSALSQELKAQEERAAQELSRLAEEAATLRKEKDTQAEELQRQLAQQQQEAAQLSADAARLQSKAAYLDEVQTENKGLHTKIEALSAEVASLQHKASLAEELQSEQRQLQDALQSQASENEKLEHAVGQLSVLREHNQRQEAEISSLSSRVATLQSRAAYVEELEAKNERYHAEISQLTADLAAANSKAALLEQLQEQNRALDVEVKRLQSELAAAQRRADLVNADLRVQNARLQEEIGAITADYGLLKDGNRALMEANTRANRQLAELRSAKVDGKGRVAAIFANASALGAGVQLIGTDPSSAEAAPEREALPVEASPMPLESAPPAPARDASPLPTRPGSEPESGGPKALQALDSENKMLQEMLSRLSTWTTEVRRGRSLSRASYDGTSPAPSEGRRTADHSPDGRLELGVDIPAAGLSPGGSRGGERAADKSPSRERRVMELLQNCRSDSTSQPRRSLTSHPLPAESDLDAIRPPDSGIAIEEPTPFATPAAQLGSGRASGLTQPRRSPRVESSLLATAPDFAAAARVGPYQLRSNEAFAEEQQVQHAQHAQQRRSRRDSLDSRVAQLALSGSMRSRGSERNALQRRQSSIPPDAANALNAALDATPKQMVERSLSQRQRSLQTGSAHDALSTQSSLQSQLSGSAASERSMQGRQSAQDGFAFSPLGQNLPNIHQMTSGMSIPSTAYQYALHSMPSVQQRSDLHAPTAAIDVSPHASASLQSPGGGLAQIQTSGSGRVSHQGSGNFSGQLAGDNSVPTASSNPNARPKSPMKRLGSMAGRTLDNLLKRTNSKQGKQERAAAAAAAAAAAQEPRSAPIAFTPAEAPGSNQAGRSVAHSPSYPAVPARQASREGPPGLLQVPATAGSAGTAGTAALDRSSWSSAGDGSLGSRQGSHGPSPSESSETLTTAQPAASSLEPAGSAFLRLRKGPASRSGYAAAAAAASENVARQLSVGDLPQQAQSHGAISGVLQVDSWGPGSARSAPRSPRAVSPQALSPRARRAQPFTPTQTPLHASATDQVQQAFEQYVDSNDIVGFMSSLGYHNFAAGANSEDLRGLFRRALRSSHPERAASATSSLWDRQLAAASHRKLQEWYSDIIANAPMLL